VGAGVRPFRPEDEGDLRAVMIASLEFDRFPGFTAWELEHELASMVGAPAGVALAVEDGVVCGYVGPRQNDLTVHPDFRRRGHGRRLLEAGLAIAANAGLNEILLYVPPTAPGIAFAQAVGLRYRSSLWLFSLAQTITVPAPVWPDGVVVRAMGDWLDLGKLVALMNASFAGHPSPMTWTRAELEQAHGRQEPGQSTTLLVLPADRPDDPVAFVRTAVQPPQADALAPLGEVRLVGVVPEWRGRGLGRELLRWGVEWLRARGAGTISLNVEAENELALGLYRRTGFEPAVEWPHWARMV
jgi:mycothiol synthase